MESLVKETLEKQMRILSGLSEKAVGNELAFYTEQIINLAKLLDPELRNQSLDEAPLPFLGHLSMSDLEELAQARRELLRRSATETQQFYKNLAERERQRVQAKELL